MANNLIQIKRSLNTANATGLANGEMAFTSNGDVLWIGANGATIPIAGKRIPGTLTANQALVANATSGIDKIITANLTLSGASVNTVNTVANLTHLGAAGNNELTSTWAIKTFVDAKIAQASNPQGSDGQFQYNNGGVLAGTGNMTYDDVANTVTIGNSTINTVFGYLPTANQIARFNGNQNTYLQVIHNNANTGNNASADYMLFNDSGVAGNGEVEYLDIGYNSSTYNDPAYGVTDAGGGYIYTANGSLAIGTKEATSDSVLKLFTGGTTADKERVRIDNSGNVGIGNTTPNAKLQVTGTANISGQTTISANLVLGAAVSANGSTGTAGYVLSSGGTGNVYWVAPTAGVAGSNSQVQFNANGVLAGDSGFTFDGVTDALTVAGTINVGSNAQLSTSTLLIGNSIANLTANSILVKVANATNIANLSPVALTIGTTTVNSTVVATGANVVANLTAFGVGQYGNVTVGGGIVNTTTIAVGNSTVNSSHTAAQIQVTNSTATANLTAVALTVGTTVVNSSVVAAGANVVANVTAFGVGQYGNTTVGGTIQNTTIFAVGNSSVNASTTAAQLSVSNSTSTANLSAAALTIGTAVANTIGFHIGSSMVANATTLKITNTTITTTNAVFGGTVAVNGSIGTAGQVLVSGAGTNAYWSSNLSLTDLTVAGNLSVTGTLTTIDANNLVVEDSIIKLASNQALTTTYTDVLDIGFYGTYGNTLQTAYTGLFRDQSDGGVFKLFNGQIPEPTTTVDTANVNFAFSTLQSFLKTGGAGATGLISNATHIAITANSTLNVAIVANSLSLSTALPATSGGTGKSTTTVGGILVGNSTNTFTELAAGTDGYVLQINGAGVVAWNTLDGGTF